MLRSTFLHLPGIGPVGERKLWSEGCWNWVDLAGRSDLKDEHRRVLEQSEHALLQQNHQFFQSLLPGSETWRTWPEFQDSTVYLDIETDGGQSGESITTVGLYDGKEFRCLVRGQDLNDFPDVISHYSSIVTFFGGGFDLPMLKRKFPHVVFDQIHIDLCPTLKQLGFRGGLKKIEVQLGITRAEEAQGLSGWDAVKLWRRYSWGRDEKALETLIAYNREDVVNLERLAQIAYDGLRARRMALID